jgi:alkanesulfonate monooxygenase SsuD/methylene tetrahydromethanopterin reductase-like flavin-dependent oxidoreductase (luciferase family)
MRIGISVGQCHRLAQPAAVAAAIRAAEQLGYSSVWVCDPLLDPAGALTAAAGLRSAVRLGTTLVLEAGRDTAALSRSLGAIDGLAGGRLSVALDSRPGSPVEEAVATVRAGGVRTMLAGTTPDALDSVARWADGWSPTGLSPDDLGPMWAEIRALAVARGRDPEDLCLVVRAGVVLTRGPAAGGRATYQGDPGQVANDVEIAHRSGAQEVVLRIDGDMSLDQALDGYARIAEAAELLRGAEDTAELLRGAEDTAELLRGAEGTAELLRGAEGTAEPVRPGQTS